MNRVFAVGTTQLCLRTHTFKSGLLLMDALCQEQDAATHQDFQRKRGRKRKKKQREPELDEREATVM